MTDEPRLSTRRRWAQLVLVAAVILQGVVGFPGVPGSDINYAVAQGECDAQCWAILAYLQDLGLNQQQIEDLGNSGLEPDPETPAIVPGDNGGYKIVEPEPPADNNQQQNDQQQNDQQQNDQQQNNQQQNNQQQNNQNNNGYSGNPSCAHGGTFPDCNENPPSGTSPADCRRLGLNGAQCNLMNGGTLPGTGCTIHSTSDRCQQYIDHETRQIAANLGIIDPPPAPLCNNGVHGSNCEQLRDLGVDEDLLSGSGSDAATFDEARQIAEETCRRNPTCDRQAMSDAWNEAERNQDTTLNPGVNRGTQAEVMCEAYGGGNVPCNPQTDEETVELVQWMCGQGYTTGYGGNCDQIDTIEEAQEEFGQNNPMTQAQSWSFNARTLEDVGYVPPFGFTPPSNNNPVNNNPDSPCLNGLTVMQAHASDGDDGCRPPSCDFGRAEDGWCLPPTNSDPPVVYVDGEDVDEDAGTARFRVVLSHATTRPVSVIVFTRDGTATRGLDYTHVNHHTVEVPARSTVRWVSVQVHSDTLDEPDETFTLNLATPSSNAELSDNPQAEATIIDNDDPTVPGAPQNLSLTCRRAGSQFRLTVGWSGSSAEPFASDYYVRFYEPDGHIDYGIRKAGSGSEQDTHTVSVSGEYRVEIEPLLLDNTRGPIGTASTQCLSTVSLDGTQRTVDENMSVTISASLDAAVSGTASVQFSTLGATDGGGSCTSGADFYVSANQFTFTDADSTSITFHACDDDEDEGDGEIVTLKLSPFSSGLRLGSPTTVTITITDTDEPQNNGDFGWGL